MKKINILLFGDKYVGKTSFATKLIYNEYDDFYIDTIGINSHEGIVKEKQYIVIDIECIFSEKCKYAKYSDIDVFIFDLTNIKTFEYIENIHEFTKMYDSRDKIKILIGNKNDMKYNNNNNNIYTNFAEKNNMKYIELSIKNDNIQEIFEKFI